MQCDPYGKFVAHMRLWQDSCYNIAHYIRGLVYCSGKPGYGLISRISSMQVTHIYATKP
jgi:hypothetical protein